MTDNYVNAPSDVTSPEAELAVALTAGATTCTLNLAAKPAHWSATPYRITFYDADNGDETIRVTDDSSFPVLDVIARGVEGADVDHAAGVTCDVSVVTVGAVQDLAAAAAAAAVAGYQPLDGDLTAIAALGPSNDDVIQRKAGAWTNRTLAQLAADMTAVVHTTGTETINGSKTFGSPLLGPNGTAALPTWSFSNDPDTGIFRPSANTIGFSTGGTSRMTITGSLMAVNIGARFSSAVSFDSEEITTATKTLTQASSKRNQILNYSGGATQDTDLPNLVAGNSADYNFIDRRDAAYSLAGGVVWTIHAPDPGGIGGGLTYATMNGVRGGTQVVGLNEEYEIKVVGPAVDDGSGDVPGVAYESRQKT